VHFVQKIYLTPVCRQTYASADGAIPRRKEAQMKWDDKQFTQSLNDLPSEPEAIRNSCESFGRAVAQKARQGSVNQEDIISAVRSGLDAGYTGTTSAGEQHRETTGASKR
jgi:hypothetical protein